MDRVRRHTLLAAVLLAVGQGAIWLLDTFAPDFPHLLRFFGFLMAMKLIGDVIYYRLWPHRREWVHFVFYLWEDFFHYLRIAFPVAVGQRLMETTLFAPYIYDGPPTTVSHMLIAGPYLAIVVYIVNRWLREEDEQNSYLQARQFLHLP